MRQQLNENPRVQLIVLGVVGIIAAVLVFSTVLKGDPATDPAAVPPAGTAATDPAAAPATGTGATAPLDSSTGSGAPAATDPAATPVDPAASAPTTPVTPTESGDLGSADGLLPSKGLPKDLLVAYANNKAIALLVYDPEGLSDQRIEAFTNPLRSRDDVEVFTVKSKDIGDYSRITSGVAVSRVPALVVIRPRKLNTGAPTATVSYGFRGPKSVDQAVDDSLYEGKPVTAYP